MTRKTYLLHARTRAFVRQVDRARRVCDDAASRGALAVGCSWGKDSVAMLHLAATQCGCPIRVMHMASPHSMPGLTEVRDQLRRLFFMDYHELPCSTLDEYIQWLKSDVGFSHERSRAEQAKVVRGLKKTRSDEWCVSNAVKVMLLGIRADENKHTRGMLVKSKGELYQRASGLWHGLPLAHWSARDVWAYTFKHGLPYHEIYDKETHGLTRETIHNSGWLTTDGARVGRLAWLKHHYPAQYRALSQVTPTVRQFA